MRGWKEGPQRGGRPRSPRTNFIPLLRRSAFAASTSPLSSSASFGQSLSSTRLFAARGREVKSCDPTMRRRARRTYTQSGVDAKCQDDDEWRALQHEVLRLGVCVRRVHRIAAREVKKEARGRIDREEPAPQRE